MAQQVIIYEQPFYPEGEPPRDYYDPRTLQSDKHFNIKPDEEVLLVVNGSGYRFMDDVIYPMHQRADTGLFIPLTPSNQQLCLVVHNISTDYTIYVGYKTPLNWLLDMPRVLSKLCYCSNTDLTQLKMNTKILLENEDIDTDHENVVANDETIVIH